jgi:hypothetical protein
LFHSIVKSIKQLASDYLQALVWLSIAKLPTFRSLTVAIGT